MIYDATVTQNLVKLNADLSRLELAVDKSKQPKSAEDLLKFNMLNPTNSGVLVESANYVDRLKLLAKSTQSQTQLRLDLAKVDGDYHRLKQCLAERETRKTKLLDLNSQIKALIDTVVLSESEITRLTALVPVLETEYADWVAAGSNNTLTRVGSDILGDVATTKKNIIDLRDAEEKDMTKIVVLKDEYEVYTRDLMTYSTIYHDIINNLKLNPNWGEVELEAEEIPVKIRAIANKAKFELHIALSSASSIRQDVDDYFLKTYEKNDLKSETLGKTTKYSTTTTVPTLGLTTLLEIQKLGIDPIELQEHIRTLLTGSNPKPPWGNSSNFTNWVVTKYTAVANSTLTAAGL